MLLIYFDEQALGETERQECYMESTQPAQGLHVWRSLAWRRISPRRAAACAHAEYQV